MTEQESRIDPRRTAAHVPRGLEVGLCVTALAWAVAAALLAERSAQGIALRLRAPAYESLLRQIFFVFLLVLGFRVLDWIATRGRFAADALPLPRRRTALGEWGLGAAIGWGLCLVAVLPLLVSGHLFAQLNGARGTFLVVPVALCALLASTLGYELVFRGYAFLRLKAAFGPSWAALLSAIGFAAFLESAYPARNLGVALVNGMLLGLLLAMAYLRTNALWVSWGLHFAYRAVAAIIFGLPIAGRAETGSIVDSLTTGPRWLSGGAFGLDAAYLTLPVLLVGLSVLYTCTREYAWEYTHPLILPAGYAVEVAPPAAHAAMEKAAAPPPAPQLIQILPAAPPPKQGLPPA